MMNTSTISATECIAVVAGSGMFPSFFISHLQKQSKKHIILYLQDNSSFNDIPPKISSDQNTITIRIGEIGRALDFCRKNHVRKIVFVGKVKRPSLLSMKLDMKGISFLSKMGLNFLKGGDDKILSYLVKLLEAEGLEVVGPEQLLPKLKMPLGVLGVVKPSKQDYEDIAIGKAILSKLGDSDVGQSVIVENNYVLGIEAAEGTDELISRCGKLKKQKTQAGVLVKMKKFSQDARIDLPGIGTKTIAQASEAGFRGVAVENNNSLIIDIDAVIKKADESNIFLIGID